MQDQEQSALEAIVPRIGNAGVTAISPELLDSLKSVLRLAESLGVPLPIRPVLTVDEAANLLSVNRKTIYVLIKKRELPGVRRIGRSLRISTEALLTWMYKGRGGTAFSR